MGKRVRISNSALNSYGFRVLTVGMDIGQYCRNPVLLDMHERGNVIGYVKDVRVEDDEITGEPVFDEASELSRRRKRQWEFGSVRMVSVGIDILELSDSAEHLVQGQTRPTITRSKLTEVSLVDIGANDDAIVLTHGGVRTELGRDGECPLPLLDNKPQNQKIMDQKVLALSLGLPETADEATINARLSELKASKEEADRLKRENDALQLARITSAVEKAVEEKRIGEDRKQQFIDLGRKIGAEELEKTFAAMSPQVRLSSVIGHQGGAPTGTQPVSYNKLSDVPVDKLEELREKQPAEYRKLYKAEYGMECEI
ncbi:hypothetical protein INE90_01142 [Bacteroides uniformis]|uniref:HK97 family phage prohead protease n=1 Tax=Bacteroidaceae TaxID=815 RepID=UPI001B8C4FB9|nr:MULTISPECIES: HK97 family phage prohead protease [Bacteroidaceae]MBT0708814.1 hypothetical protein [Phocaeicola vulgatus]QUT34397.1 hypothetical protein INE90_01142 [Bacteroides uniformis]